MYGLGSERKALDAAVAAAGGAALPEEGEFYVGSSREACEEFLIWLQTVWWRAGPHAEL